MSWAITKKAINSDLSEPLNEKIESGKLVMNGKTYEPKISSLHASLFVENASASYVQNLLAISTDEEFIYMGGNGGILLKVRISDMATVGQTSALYGGNAIAAISNDENYVYTSSASAGTVKKIDKQTLATLSDSSALAASSYVVINDSSFVYASTSIVTKFNKSNMSTAVTSGQILSGNAIHAMSQDATDIYLGGAGVAPDRTVRRVSKSNLSQTLAAPNDYTGTILAIAVDDNFVYFGGNSTSTPLVTKLIKTNLTIDSTASYGATGTGIQAIAIDDNFVYVGGGGGTPIPPLIKFNKGMFRMVEGPSLGEIRTNCISLSAGRVFVNHTTTNKCLKHFNGENIIEYKEV